jgi:hypothetical protein
LSSKDNATGAITGVSFPVSSVFGRTGVVTANTGDYTATKVTVTGNGSHVATDVQTSLNAIDTAVGSNTTSIALKANNASPTLTGVPAAPTAAADTNTTQLATTGYVVGQASSTTPVVDGTGAVGTSLRYARGDHVHPTDTTRAPLNNPDFTGNVGIGSAHSSTTGVLLNATGTGNYSTQLNVTNADGTDTGSQAAVSALADVANLTLFAQGTARTISRWGHTIGGWNEVLGAAGSGLSIGTVNARPLQLGTSSAKAIEIDSAQNTTFSGQAIVNTTTGGALKVTRPTTGPGTITITSGSFAYTLSNSTVYQYMRPGDSITVGSDTRTINTVNAFGGDVTAAWASNCTTCVFTLSANTPLNVDPNGDVKVSGAVYIAQPGSAQANQFGGNEVGLALSNQTQTGTARISVLTGTLPINTTPSNYIELVHRSSTQSLGHPAYPYTNWHFGMIGDRNFRINMYANTDALFENSALMIDTNFDTTLWGGLTIGDASGSGGAAKITKFMSATTTWDPPNSTGGNGSSSVTTVTVSGAAPGDTCAASLTSLSTLTAAGIGLLCNVDTNLVRVSFINLSGGAVDPASGTLRVDVWKH